jgi:hypothetical protein
MPLPLNPPRRQFQSSAILQPRKQEKEINPDTKRAKKDKETEQKTKEKLLSPQNTNIASFLHTLHPDKKLYRVHDRVCRFWLFTLNL